MLRMHAEIETYEMVKCADMKAEAKALLDHEHARLLAERDAATTETVVAPSEVAGWASGKRRRPGEEPSGEETAEPPRSTKPPRATL